MKLGNRERSLLILLAAVAVVVFGVRLTGSGGDGEGPVRRVLGGREPPPLAGSINVVELRSADLIPQPGEFQPGRDPWRFGAAPPPAPPPAPPRAPPPPRPIPVAPRQPPPPAVPPAPKPPPVDVTFMGTVGPPIGRIAVFFDADGGIYNASVGELVKQHFRVYQIGLESVDLEFVGFPEAPPTRLKVGG